MYKGRRYNAIIVLLIFIISAVVGVSAGMSGAPFPLNPGGDNGSVIVPPEPEVVPPGIKPPAANAKSITKLNFAIKQMNTGKGYKSQTVQTLTIHALGLQQYMKFSKYRGGGLDFTQEWFKFSGTGPLASSGKNEYRSMYNDGTTMHEKIINSSSKFSYDNKTVELSADGEIGSFPVTEYTGTRNRMPLNDFFIEIKEEYLSGDIKEDKRSDPNNYIITVIFNTNAIPARYLSAFSENGGSGTKILGLKLTFHISKKTGYIRKVRKDEDFVSSQGPLSSNCTTVLEEEFTVMNQSFESDIKRMATEGYGITF